MYVSLMVGLVIPKRRLRSRLLTQTQYHLIVFHMDFSRPKKADLTMQPFDTMDPFSKVLKKIFRNKFTRDSFHPSLDTHEQVSPQPSLTVAKEETVLYNTMHFIHVIHHLKR